VNWWQRLLRRREQERQLDAELRFHLDRRVEDLVRAGRSDEAARREARLEFGGLDQMKEACRDARGTRSVEDLAQDLRFVMRLFTRRRAFTVMAVIVLALGIGVNGVFFTLVEMICIRGLPLDRPDRIMYVATRDARDRPGGMSYHDFDDVRSTARTFAAVAAFAGTAMGVGEEGRAPDRFRGAYVSASAFRVIGETPMLGRDFRAEDDRVGAPPVVIIGDRVWRERYGRDPAIVGRAIRVNGVPSIVIGVMRDGFKYPPNSDVWQPLASMTGVTSQRRDARALGIVARLADGISPAHVWTELDAIGDRLSVDHPDTNKGVRIAAVPINEHYNGNATDAVWLAFITAGALVLLIACANVANLLLIRATERAREIAVRASLGATRGRVIRQLLAENLVLALLGGVFGVAFSLVGLRVVSSFAPPDVLPYWMDFRIDARILTVLTAVCLATSFAFGLLPALYLSKTNVHGVLKDGGWLGLGGVAGRRWTAAFLTSQLALTVVLLANLRLGSVAQAGNDPAIDMPRLLTMSVALPAQKYETAANRSAFYTRLDDRLRSIRSVNAAAVASALPLGGASTRELIVEGRQAPNAAEPWTVRTMSIGPRYFETMGLVLYHGRSFDDRDGAGGYDNAIVNRRFVEMFFAESDPIGRRIQLRAEGAGPAPWLTIVGISPSVRQRTLPEPDPIVYVPYRADPPASAAVIVHGPSKPAAIVPLLREVVREIDPDLPLYRIMTMEQAVKELRWNARTSHFLISVLTCIAVGLSAVGLYAAIAHAVAQRTREIGIRIAIGAQPGGLRWLVLRRAMLHVGAGLAFGLLCTILWERAFTDDSGLGSFSDPLSLIAAAAVLVVAGVAACLSPMHRVTRLDPVVALRCE
jgi:putative ABC transport system permease protein